MFDIPDDVQSAPAPAPRPAQKTTPQTAETSTGDTAVWTRLIDHYKGRLSVRNRVFLDMASGVVADGCLIDGTVRNSIIFRDVRIARDACVENSIVMQGAIICEKTVLNCAVLDKDVVIKASRNLSGAEDYPIFIDKGTVV